MNKHETKKNSTLGKAQGFKGDDSRRRPKAPLDDDKKGRIEHYKKTKDEERSIKSGATQAAKGGSNLISIFQRNYVKPSDGRKEFPANPRWSAEKGSKPNLSSTKHVKPTAKSTEYKSNNKGAARSQINSKTNKGKGFPKGAKGPIAKSQLTTTDTKDPKVSEKSSDNNSNKRNIGPKKNGRKPTRGPRVKSTNVSEIVHKTSELSIKKKLKNFADFSKTIIERYKFSDARDFFRYLCGQLFQEELLIAEESESMKLLDSDVFQVEWFTDISKRHRQYNLSILMDDEIQRGFNSKLQLGLPPFYKGMVLFLMNNKGEYWPGIVCVSEMTHARRNMRYDILQLVVQMFDWFDKVLPTTEENRNLKILTCSYPVSLVFSSMEKLRNSKFRDHILGLKQNNMMKFGSSFKIDALNESQTKAVKFALNNPLTIIKGPPGTGKTTVIFEIIRKFIDNLNISPILVVAATNIAIDNIAEKLVPIYGTRALRVVSVSKEREYGANHPLGAYCLHNHVFNGLSQSMKDTVNDLRNGRGHLVGRNKLKSLNAESYRLTRKHVALARIILTTTVLSGTRRISFLRSIPAVIMDEATQSTEASSIIPISLENVSKLVLVGDEEQLSAVARVKSLGTSLFQKFLINETVDTTVMLDTQYRMHPDISAFLTKHIYNEKLLNGISEDQRKYSGFKDAVYVWDTRGKLQEGFRRITGLNGAFHDSYYNTGEVDLVLQVLTGLILELQVPRESIGIVTPYAAQRDLIVKRISQNDIINSERSEKILKKDGDDIEESSDQATVVLIAGIMVASVDAFQGRERDFIIMSCVRSNNKEKKSIGFVLDRRRLNVAVTRAKYGLIIIGDVTKLSNGSELWKVLFDEYREKKFIHKSSHFNYLGDIETSEDELELGNDPEETAEFEGVRDGGEEDCVEDDEVEDKNEDEDDEDDVDDDDDEDDVDDDDDEDDVDDDDEDGDQVEDEEDLDEIDDEYDEDALDYEEDYDEDGVEYDFEERRYNVFYVDSDSGEV